nr:putative reverse transcriptase domain, aspartic peptidase domain protein [Tanacetum cinerariifolium]
MVNTRTDADLSAAIQNALQTLLPWIREEIREEFRTGSGSSNAGGNPPPVANAARNYEILHEREDDDTKRPDKRRGGSDNHRSSNNNNSYSGSNNRNSGNGRDQRNRGHQSNRSANSGIPVMDGTKETGVISPTDLPILVLSSPGVPLRATLTQYALLVGVDTNESVIELQFVDKIRAINSFPLDMCEFDLILGMDWLTEHHATIDCHSYRVIFGDIHGPEYTYHGSLPGKPMQIILALQARTLLYHGCEGLLATIHDTTSEVPSVHDQPIVLEFPNVYPDELPGIPPVH